MSRVGQKKKKKKKKKKLVSGLYLLISLKRYGHLNAE